MVVTYWVSEGGKNDVGRVIGDNVPVTDPGLDSLMAS